MTTETMVAGEVRPLDLIAVEYRAAKAESARAKQALASGTTELHMAADKAAQKESALFQELYRSALGLNREQADEAWKLGTLDYPPCP